MHQSTHKSMTLFIFIMLCAVGASGLAQSWSPAGAMQQPRYSHEQLLLNNGKVLVLGGMYSQPGSPIPTWLTSVELYDPVANSWSPAASMSTPHGAPGGSAVLLLDGRVLVAGGLNWQTPTSKVEIYDPDTNTWSDAAPLSQPRWDHAITLLSDGRVLVVGGQFGYGCNTTATAELYDPVSNTWRSTGALLSARENIRLVRLQDGRILQTCGGAYCGPSGYRDVEVYNPATEIWSQVASTQFCHSQGDNPSGLVLLSDGKVLIATGVGDWGSTAKAEVYDPSLDQWLLTGDLSNIKLNMTSTLITNDQVLVAGGQDNSGLPLYSSCDLYDPITMTWKPAAPLSIPRIAHRATLLPNGKVLVSGGQTIGGGCLATAELFDSDPLWNAEIQPPINKDGSSVFKANRGTTPVKFTLTANGLTTCDLPGAQIAVYRISETVAGLVNESDFIMPSDSGLNFRIADCQYNYNLSTGSLGQGSYVVQIIIHTKIVGTARFSLK